MENFIFADSKLNAKNHIYLLFQEKMAILEQLQSKIKTNNVFLISIINIYLPFIGYKQFKQPSFPNDRNHESL